MGRNGEGDAHVLGEADSAGAAGKRGGETAPMRP